MVFTAFVVFLIVELPVGPDVEGIGVLVRAAPVRTAGDAYFHRTAVGDSVAPGHFPALPDFKVTGGLIQVGNDNLPAAQRTAVTNYSFHAPSPFTSRACSQKPRLPFVLARAVSRAFS